MYRWAYALILLLSVSAFGHPQDSFEKLGLTLQVPTDSMAQIKKGQGFLISDRWGNNWVAFPSDSAAVNQASIAFSEFYAATGLFHVPYWPVLIRVNPEKESETVEETEARWKLGKVTPESQLEAKSISDADAPWEVIETRAILRWLDYGLRSNGRTEFWRGDYLLAGTPSHHFSYLLNSNKSSLFQTYFSGSLFPWRRLAAATPEQAQSLLDKLYPVLDRIEAIADSHVESLFGPLFLAASVPAQDPKIIANLLSAIRTSFRELRADIQLHLTKKIRGPFKNVDLMAARKKARVVASPLRFAEGFRNRWPSLRDPSFVASHARQLLYIYMASPSHERQNAISQWREETGIPDPLQLLVHVAANNDGSTRWIAGELPLDPRSVKDRPASTTFFLNPEARRNLIVFSEADAEGQKMAELLENLPSSHRVGHFAFNYRNGTKLTEGDIQALLKIFERQNHSRLVLCELGGLPPEVREQLKKENRFWNPGDSFFLEDVERNGKPPVLLIDHHESDQTAWQKRSSLEQLILYLGYQPEMDQVIAGIVDRSGVTGLAELGMSKEEVSTYLANRTTNGRFQSLVRLGEQSQLNPDRFFWVNDANFSFPDVSRASGLATYPRTANFVLVSNARVFVHSTPKVIYPLANNEWAKELDLVLGGDGRKSAYLLLRLPSNPAKSALALDNLTGALAELETQCKDLILGN
jgi:hypothetical protein